VSARFDRTARGYAGGGGTTVRENIATWIGSDLACVVDLERHHTRLDDNADPVVFVYRTTHVLQPRETAAWRSLLRPDVRALATFPRTRLRPRPSPVGQVTTPQEVPCTAQARALQRDRAIWSPGQYPRSCSLQGTST